MTPGPVLDGGVRTTCPYCGVGCGVVASASPAAATAPASPAVSGLPGLAALPGPPGPPGLPGPSGLPVRISGDSDHPANFGRLCSKGSALGETLGSDGRLLEPEVDGRIAGWDQALDLVAGRLTEVLETDGPDAIAFYLSGQLLTEDYYVANKLMKGFIGTANVDTNSRLCMASSVAGHKRAFGEDLVPGLYADLEEADLVVLVGSNFAWCHPILHQRLLAARQTRGTRIITIDPRRTATATDSDQYLALAPGSDVLLFNGLLAHLARHQVIDHDYTERATRGLAEAVALASADAPTVARVARGCGLAEADVLAFYDAFARTPRTVTVHSQGVNQSAHGTDKVNAIINCHLATGRIGRPGAGPFSITGQPNAMGGREVGGLANQLAAHMGFDDDAAIERVGRFWQAPRIARRAGLKAVDLFDAVADGRIKALWVMGTNPAVSMPDAGRVRRALARCPFVIVSDITRTDTTRLADVLLPAEGWGEKDGTVTNSERRISRQRRFQPAPGSARADWRIVVDVAQRMGFGEAFDYPGPAAIFREHAALSAFENDGDRLFDIGALATISDCDYDALTPLTWPCPAVDRGNVAGSGSVAAPDSVAASGSVVSSGSVASSASVTSSGSVAVPGGSADAEGRLLGSGRFPTPDGRARFIAVRHEGPVAPADLDFPLALNSGRLRDQWHTMSRTGRVPRLMANAPEAVCDLNPADAAAAGISDGDLVRLDNAQGFVRCVARLTDAQRRGEAFLPMHWSGSFAANSAAGTVALPNVDPHSGQPELKHAPVRLRRENKGWEGVLITRRDLRPTGLVHWSRQAVEGGWLYALAGTETVNEGILLARHLVDPRWRPGLSEYIDKRGAVFRAAATDDSGALAEAVLVAPPDRLPSRDWFLALLASGQPLGRDERRALLSGRAPVALPSLGRIICSCFSVGINQIRDAVKGGCTSVDEVGRSVRAGTNCGSCRAEIKGVIDATRVADHAGI